MNSVRPAQPHDFSAVHALICALAEFEQAPNEVVVTPESLLHDWQDQRFDVWVAECAGAVRGMALGFWRYSTWKGPTYHLEDLVVDAAYRGRGLGGLLFRTVAEHAAAHGAQRLHWEVLDWNTPAVRFYESLGAEIARNWWPCRLDRTGLERLGAPAGAAADPNPSPVQP